MDASSIRCEERNSSGGLAKTRRRNLDGPGRCRYDARLRGTATTFVLRVGEVAEWSNAPDSKSGLRFRRNVGSNPTLSASFSRGLRKEPFAFPAPRNSRVEVKRPPET